MVRAILVAAIFVVASASGAIAQGAAPAPVPVEPVVVGGPEALEPAADPVVAIVNGEEIRASEVILFFQTLNPDLQQIPIAALFPQLLEASIDRKLAAQRGAAEGLYADPDILQKIRIFADQLVEDLLLRRAVDAAMTEEAMQAEYQKVVAESAELEEVRISHILLATQEEAFDVIGLIQEGADFAQMARERSLGPSNVDGGDLDFVAPGQTIPAFEVEAFALGVGQMTQEPVQTEFGWHVILVTGRRPGQAPPFEEVTEYLQDQISRVAVEEFYLGLNEGMEIERFNIDGTPIVEVEEVVEPVPGAAPVLAPEPAPVPAR